MERLYERITLAEKALARLHELAGKADLSDIERDALIQRFEFSFEILWKCARDYLFVEHGIDAASPKKVIRACRDVGIFDDDQTKEALMMADDRNLTTHTYDEEFAQRMVCRVADYDELLQVWLEKIKPAEQQPTGDGTI